MLHDLGAPTLMPWVCPETLLSEPCRKAPSPALQKHHEESAETANALLRRLGIHNYPEEAQK